MKYISRTRIWNKNDPRKVYSNAGPKANPLQAVNLKSDIKYQFSTVARAPIGKSFLSCQVARTTLGNGFLKTSSLKNLLIFLFWTANWHVFYWPLLFIGIRTLHIKYDPAEIARSITVTEDVTLEKLGFANKNEAASLSNEEVVNKINAKLLEIFGVKSKEEIGGIDTKEILAKLDCVFKIREDNQPNVDYPVRKIIIHQINYAFHSETT